MEDLRLKIFGSCRYVARSRNYVVIVVMVALGLTGCNRGKWVTVAERTKSLHRAECGKVQMAHTHCAEVTRDVLARYSVCPLCKPDVAL